MVLSFISSNMTVFIKPTVFNYLQSLIWKQNIKVQNKWMDNMQPEKK